MDTHIAAAKHSLPVAPARIPVPTCVVCGRALSGALQQLGSLRCHDCRADCISGRGNRI